MCVCVYVCGEKREGGRMGKKVRKVKYKIFTTVNPVVKSFLE